MATASLPLSPALLSTSRRLLRTRASTAASPSPINADYLGREFGRRGVTFEALGDGCVVKMALETGGSASLMLPSGLVASYKPFMWHGSAVEVLHTCVSEGDDGGAVVRGGVSVGVRCGWDGWAPSCWDLRDVRGASSRGSLQVELISVDPEGCVEIKNIITLQEDLLGSEVVITNLKSSPLDIFGSLISHLKVSTPDATYAMGLQGSNYYNKEPLLSDFSIIPPDFGKGNSYNKSRSWGQKALKGLLSSWGRAVDEDDKTAMPVSILDEAAEGEEKENSMIMTEQMSRLFTCAPRQLTLIDRGRRNSVVVERIGFDELYMFSPGSNYEWYGKYSYICIGPAAILAPVQLGSREVWSGGLYLHNPNM